MSTIIYQKLDFHLLGKSLQFLQPRGGTWWIFLRPLHGKGSILPSGDQCYEARLQLNSLSLYRLLLMPLLVYCAMDHCGICLTRLNVFKWRKMVLLGLLTASHHHHPAQNVWLQTQALSWPCNTHTSPSNLLQLQFDIGCSTSQGCPASPALFGQAAREKIKMLSCAVKIYEWWWKQLV